jgi:hypothetical protein
VCEHDVDTVAIEAPAQPQHRVGHSDRAERVPVRQRRQIGIAPAIWPGAERNNRVVMTTRIKAGGELERECLRTAATTCPDDVEDTHALILPRIMMRTGLRGASVPCSPVIRADAVDRRK